MLAAITYTCPLRFFSDFRSKPDANALLGTYTHRKNRCETQMHVLIPRPTAANWANAATCNLCHELLRHVRTCHDWLQTHPTQWTTTTITIRILFEHERRINYIHIQTLGQSNGGEWSWRNVNCVWGKRNVQNCSQKENGKENLVWRPGQVTENNIKMDLRGLETVNWIRVGDI